MYAQIRIVEKASSLAPIAHVLRVRDIYRVIHIGVLGIHPESIPHLAINMEAIHAPAHERAFPLGRGHLIILVLHIDPFSLLLL